MSAVVMQADEPDTDQYAAHASFSWLGAGVMHTPVRRS